MPLAVDKPSVLRSNEQSLDLSFPCHLFGRLMMVGSFVARILPIPLQLLLELVHCIPVSLLPQCAYFHLTSSLSHVVSPQLFSPHLTSPHLSLGSSESELFSFQQLFSASPFNAVRLNSVLLTSPLLFSCRVISTHPISSHLL